MRKVSGGVLEGCCTPSDSLDSFFGPRSPTDTVPIGVLRSANSRCNEGGGHRLTANERRQGISPLFMELGDG
jgi:hypothetical protein